MPRRKGNDVPEPFELSAKTPGDRSGWSSFPPKPAVDGPAPEYRDTPRVITQQMVRDRMKVDGLYDMESTFNRMDYMVAYSLATKRIQDDHHAGRKGVSNDRWTTTDSMYESRLLCDHCGGPSAILAAGPSGSEKWCQACLGPNGYVAGEWVSER